MPLRMLFAMVAVSATTLQSVVALGACHTILRGELVPDSRPQDPRVRVVPQKLLFFSLDEIRRDSGHPVATAFQSFAIPNDRTSFPIPFELAVHSSRDCPRELSLYVSGSNREGFHYEYPLRGWAEISPDKPEFLKVIVYRLTF